MGERRRKRVGNGGREGKTAGIGGMGGARAGREEEFLGKGRLKRRARQMARPKTRLSG